MQLPLTNRYVRSLRHKALPSLTRLPKRSARRFIIICSSRTSPVSMKSGGGSPSVTSMRWMTVTRCPRGSPHTNAIEKYSIVSPAWRVFGGAQSWHRLAAGAGLCRDDCGPRNTGNSRSTRALAQPLQLPSNNHRHTFSSVQQISLTALCSAILGGAGSDISNRNANWLCVREVRMYSAFNIFISTTTFAAATNDFNVALLSSLESI
ncbi:hypothetical protein PHYPSEUDO_015184 [Phytophthora pseudosyringae]|uniref:Uncharacterized protein n=1 Tax=Phytophthora pseudosyringae TaxID=221518 RepID=A0A8T1W492_9STRA|nr:hypothetical protein PHYPSEUDO_015184 [Phytophthora pseudosyringae]